MANIAERLRSWAQNEEMIDQHFLDHGRDCNEAADEIERLRKLSRAPRVRRGADGTLVLEYEEHHTDLSLGKAPDEERIAQCERMAHLEPGVIRELIDEIGGGDG